MEETPPITFSDTVMNSIFGEVAPDSEFEKIAEFIKRFPVIRRSELKNKDNVEILVNALNFNDAVIFGHDSSKIKDLAEELNSYNLAEFRDYFYAVAKMIPKSEYDKAYSGKLNRKEIAVITLGEPFNHMVINASDAYRPALIFNIPNQLFFDRVRDRTTYHELVHLMGLVNIIYDLSFPIIFLFDDETDMLDLRTDEQRKIDAQKEREEDNKRLREINEARRRQKERRREFMNMIEDGKFPNKDN